MPIYPDTPYLFYEIHVPRRRPYWDVKPRKGQPEPAQSWPSIVGDFCLPLLAEHADSLVWHVQEGSHFQICFATIWPKEVEASVRHHAKLTGFRVKRLLRGHAGGALGGQRWNPTRLLGTEQEAFRSIKLLRTLDALCRLYADTLIQVPAVKKRGKVVTPGYWYAEAPEDTRQNPFGSIFESFTHLVANTTEARFAAYIDVRTGWMHEGPMRVSLPLHL